LIVITSAQVVFVDSGKFALNFFNNFFVFYEFDNDFVAAILIAQGVGVDDGVRVL